MVHDYMYYCCSMHSQVTTCIIILLLLLLLLLLSIYNCPCNVCHGSKVKLHVHEKKPWRQGETAPTILQMEKLRKKE